MSAVTATFDDRMIALAASAAYADVSAVPVDLEDAFGDESGAVGGAFVVPMLIPEGVETGDGRSFKTKSLSSRDLPLPLMWQVTSDSGHDGSVIVGRIDEAEVRDGVGIINLRGVFDTGPYGREAERLVRGGFLRGISADLDMFEGSVRPAPTPEPPLPPTSLAGEDAEAEDGEKAKDGGEQVEHLAADKVTVSTARLTAATLVAKPAFQESIVYMADQAPGADGAGYVEDEIPLGDGPYEEESGDASVLLASLVAAAVPVAPPRGWFDTPTLAGPSPITVEDDGRVFGHIATWNTHHIGLPRATPPPRSRSGYRYFRTGVLRTAEGSDVPVGQLTLAGGHANLLADAATAIQHYDDTASAVADVSAGEDAYGIWVAGSLRPGVTPEQVRVLRASAPSGDWRPIEGRLELVAVCQVNVPGFPVARTMVASGQVTALVAAGASEMAELRAHTAAPVDGHAAVTAARLDVLERRLERDLNRENAAARARVRSLSLDRGQRLLAGAAGARERLRVLSTERTQTLNASADTARARLTEFRAGIGGIGIGIGIGKGGGIGQSGGGGKGLRVMPKFVEVQHPRHDDGKFRVVLGRLNDLLGDVEGGDKATRAVSDAADAEDKGQSTDKAVADAKATLERLDTPDADEATRGKIQEAKGLLDAAADATTMVDDVTVTKGDVPQLLDYLMNEVVSAVDPTAAVRNAPAQIARQLKGKEFTDTAELASYLQELIRRAVSPT